MKLTKEMLIDWIYRPPSNSDLDLINYIINLQNNRDKAIKKCQDKQYQTNHEWLKKFAKELENLLKGDSDE